jgi:hypothetical protein
VTTDLCVIKQIMSVSWPSTRSATVLCVKSYPSQEIAVMLHDMPCVITLRNLNIFTHSTTIAEVQCMVPEKTGNAQFHNIRDGMQINVVDIGVWNVHTSALHYPKIILPKDEVATSVNQDNRYEQGVVGVRHQSVEALPKRRRQCSMN